MLRAAWGWLPLQGDCGTQLAQLCDCCVDPPTSLLQALDKRDKDLREKLGSVRDNSSELNSLQEQAEKVTVLWLTGLMAALLALAAGCAADCACSLWGESSESGWQLSRRKTWLSSQASTLLRCHWQCWKE